MWKPHRLITVIFRIWRVEIGKKNRVKTKINGFLNPLLFVCNNFIQQINKRVMRE